MTIQYEDIYPPFSSLTYAEQLELIEKIRFRRSQYFTPKRQKSQAKKEVSAKQSRQSKQRSILDSLTEEEKRQLLEELDDGGSTDF